MAARPQNSPRGLFAKDTIQPATLDISGNMSWTANSTGIVVADVLSDIPGAVDNGNLFGFVKNSTGFAMFFNSTGTTNLWVAGTTKQPTT